MALEISEGESQCVPYYWGLKTHVDTPIHGDCFFKLEAEL